MTDNRLAICIFPTNTLQNTSIIEHVMDYTTKHMLQTGLDIFHATDIDSAMHGLYKKYDHVLLAAAGTCFLDLTILEEIKNLTYFDYFVAGDVFYWEDDWFEMHHNLILVNSKKWSKYKKPKFGSWVHGYDNLPSIRMSEECFQSSNPMMPMQITFDNTSNIQYHSKQGWNYIATAGNNNDNIIIWNTSIKQKKMYFYPEVNSAQLLEHINKLELLEDENEFNHNKFLNSYFSLGHTVTYKKET